MTKVPVVYHCRSCISSSYTHHNHPTAVMAPRTKPKLHRHKKVPGRRTGKARRKSWRLSLIRDPQPKSIVPDSRDPLEENILATVPMPDGYVFVPKGDVYVTRTCRIKTKESHQAVYTVYNKTGKRVEGIRVPAEIYSNVLDLAKATCEARASAVQARDTKFISQGRQLLREQFPLMPEESLEMILGHSFLKGSGRVGRTSTTTDKRKATLAVEAHIRHKHTPYESLLASGTDRKEARESVWPSVQAIKKAWEGKAEPEIIDLTLR